MSLVDSAVSTLLHAVRWVSGAPRHAIGWVCLGCRARVHCSLPPEMCTYHAAALLSSQRCGCEDLGVLWRRSAESGVCVAACEWDTFVRADMAPRDDAPIVIDGTVTESLSGGRVVRRRALTPDELLIVRDVLAGCGDAAADATLSEFHARVFEAVRGDAAVVLRVDVNVL